MEQKMIAKASTTIRRRDRVWDALVNPKLISSTCSERTRVGLEEGSPIVWKGEWQGRKYETRACPQMKPEQMIQYSITARFPDFPKRRRTTTP